MVLLHLCIMWHLSHDYIGALILEVTSGTLHTKCWGSRWSCNNMLSGSDQALGTPTTLIKEISQEKV